jgi:transposase-like protein
MRNGMSFIEAATTPATRRQIGTGAKALCRNSGIAPVVGYSTVHERLNKAMPLIEAMTTPPQLRQDLGPGAIVLCRQFGVTPVASFNTVNRRLRSGMSFAEAVTTPPLLSFNPTSKKAIAHRRTKALRAELHRRFTAKGLRDVSETELMKALRAMGAFPASIASLARKHGINPGTVHSRMQRGITLEQALTTPLKTSKKIIERARQHGLKYATFYYRMRQGWSLERALTEPLPDRSNSISAQARVRGLKPHTVLKRMSNLGWSLERALTAPLRPRNPNSIAEQARARGLNPGTVIGRMGRGMTLEQALTTPLDLSQRRATKSDAVMV